MPFLRDAAAQSPVGPGKTTGVAWDTNAPKLQAALQARVGGSLAAGTTIRGGDGKDYTPQQYMQAQSAAGSPMGMLYDAAVGNARENQIQNSGAAEIGQYTAGQQALASGRTGQAAYAPVGQAISTLQNAGQGGLQLGQQSGQAAMATAAGMNPDVARLRAAADGTVPSAAQIQQQQGISNAINSQASLAAGARGGNLAAAMRGAQAAGAGIQAQGIANNAALRANEMAAARGQLTQATGTQGALQNQAGQTFNSGASVDVGRANAAAQSANAMASGILGSQISGTAGLFNGYQAAQDRTQAAIGQDVSDQDRLNNYILQMTNQGLGFGAQNYSTDQNNQTARTGQLLQTIGAGASALGATGAGLAMYR